MRQPTVPRGCFASADLDASLALARHARDDRPIHLLDPPLGEQRPEPPQRLLVPPEHENARRVAVEPVRQRRRLRQPEAQQREPVFEVRPAARPGMHRNPGRLVDNQHQPVAVEHAVREIHDPDIVAAAVSRKADDNRRAAQSPPPYRAFRAVMRSIFGCENVCSIDEPDREGPMRWLGGRESSNIEDRRGVGVARGVGIGGIGTVAIVLIGLFLGVDPSILLDMVGRRSGAADADRTARRSGLRFVRRAAQRRRRPDEAVRVGRAGRYRGRLAPGIRRHGAELRGTEARSVFRRRPVRLRHGVFRLGSVLLPARSQGLSRPVVLRGHAPAS